jgi:hypothetical protein
VGRGKGQIIYQSISRVPCPCGLDLRTDCLNPGHTHELTFSCYRRGLYFNDPVVCKMMLDEIEKARRKFRFDLWAYVIMPNYILRRFLIYLSRQYNLNRLYKPFRLHPAEEHAASECLAAIVRRIKGNLMVSHGNKSIHEGTHQPAMQVIHCDENLSF